MFDYECVSIDGVVCIDAGTAVTPGNVVSLRYNPDQRYREKKKPRWDDRTFSVVFEDDDLIVVDKAAGTLTVPTDRGEETNTLWQRVSIYISHSRRNREAALVHRLDRSVSGLLVFGKHDAVGELLIEQFKAKKPRRVYAAIVAGLVAQDEGTFKSHLKTGKNLDRFEAPPSKDTEEAITHFKVEKRFTSPAADIRCWAIRVTKLKKQAIRDGSANESRCTRKLWASSIRSAAKN
jgi:23S rRNA pseudouridine1911/1915/1917 synthase